jgi:hypothetical protein
MKKLDISNFIYILIIILVFTASQACSQITVKHFNAAWNESNGVDWIMKLKDCKTKSYVDIAKDPDAQKKYKIAVVPTIIIFKDGEQADLSFKLLATREEVQEEIDEQLMSDF